MRAGRRAACLGLLAATLLVACDALPAPTPSGCPTAAPTADEATEILDGVTTAEFDTSLGAFTVTLNLDAAPMASANFVALARCGFYNGLTFHRVLSGMLIQAGDPNTRRSQEDFEGLGTSGPGYGYAIELPPEGLNYDQYTVAMVNGGGPDGNGSQFLIALADLDAQFGERIYTIFGLVTEGQEVVDAIGQVEVTGVTGVPVDPVLIRSIEIPIAESTPS
jgi:cyclophilin family peptidyl-prolyl cis-trans isomerase